MGDLFYNLGRWAAPGVRKAKWAWKAATGPESEAIAAEKAVGADMARYVRQQCKSCPDDEHDRMLSAIGRSLVAGPAKKYGRFHFECIDRNKLEAFCLPGGFIFVSESMMQFCGPDRDMLAFVLAHEIAHVAKGHAIERMVSSALIRTVSHSGPVRHLVTGALNRTGMQLLEKAYSRDQEKDADKLGLQLAISAGYDGYAAVRFFEKLAANDDKPLLGEYFSTHPACQKRITWIRQILSESTS